MGPAKLSSSARRAFSGAARRIWVLAEPSAQHPVGTEVPDPDPQHVLGTKAVVDFDGGEHFAERIFAEDQASFPEHRAGQYAALLPPPQG